MKEQEIEYHLNCDNCDNTFWSKEAFPTPHLCNDCITPQKDVNIDYSREDGK